MLKVMTDRDWRLAFRAWVEQQPDDRSYSYIDTDDCAVAQYANAIGYRLDWASSSMNDSTDPLIRATHNRSRVISGGAEPPTADRWTYGALKQRLASSPDYQ